MTRDNIFYLQMVDLWEAELLENMEDLQELTRAELRSLLVLKYTLPLFVAVATVVVLGSVLGALGFLGCVAFIEYITRDL